MKRKIKGGKKMNSEKQNLKKNKKDQKENEEEEEEDIKPDNPKDDLYSLLKLTKEATKDQIRKAYKNLVILCHPDKNKEDPNTAEKFVSIQRAYEILYDDEKRKIYDETGEFDEDLIDIKNTKYYFRKIFDFDVINNFAKKYINSKEEINDLIEFYLNNDGDLTTILEEIPLSKNDDIPRFIKIYENLFRDEKLEKNENFEKTKNKIKLLKEEAEEAKEEIDKLGDLQKQIMLKNKSRKNDLLDQLMNKYCNEDEVYEDIDDKEFEKYKKDIEKKPNKKNKKKNK